MVELCIVVQIQNIGEVFFHSPPSSSSDLMHTQVARLTTPTGTSAPSLAASMTEMKYAVFSANWQPGVPKYNWVNWQWVGYTDQNRQHFQRTITDCSIVFQINKYVNLACFLHICKHIMVFLCFSRVKNLHTALTLLFLLTKSGLKSQCIPTLKK